MTITTEATVVLTKENIVIDTMPGQLRGPRGLAGGETFTWTQSIALAIWTIAHNLGKYPSVIVVDTTGDQVIPDVTYIDQNTIQVTHGLPMAGSAYLN